MTTTLRGHVDASQLRRLAGKSSELEPKLKTALRRRLRAAAAPAASDVKAAILQTPASGGNSGKHTGLRENMAAGVKVLVMAGKKAGVTIQTSASALPANQKSLVRAYGKKKGWRHLTFGHDPWQTQKGSPNYFYKPLGKHRAQFTAAARAAMSEAAQSLK